jgi:hypothetical protein
MTTKAHRRSRRSQRLGRVGRKCSAQWLLVLIAQTLATILTVIVERWLGLTTSGGR